MFYSLNEAPYDLELGPNLRLGTTGLADCFVVYVVGCSGGETW
jgi:hypothetical protein